MECNILAVSDGKLKKVLQAGYNSLVWECCYFKTGAIQAVFPVTIDTLKHIKTGNFLSLSIDATSSSGGYPLAYIHTVEIKETEIWAYAYEAKELLKKCIVDNWLDSENVLTSDILEDAFADYIPFNWVHSTPILDGITATLNPAAYSYGTVYDLIADACRANNAGWRLEYDDYNEKAVMFCWVGADKTNTAIFAKSHGNMRDSSYTESDKNYINTVIALGSDNITQMYTESYTGDAYTALLDLREEYPRPDDMSVADYQAAILTRAKMSCIARHKTTATKANDINTDDFNKTYQIGDLVKMVVVERGTYVVSDTRRVTAATYVVDRGAQKVRLTIE